MSIPFRAYLLCFLLVSACGSPEPEEPPGDPSVVAVFEGGQITRSDLDRAILSIPPGERRALGSSLEFHQELVRELAVHRIALERAMLQGDAKSLEHASALRELERQAHVEQYLREQPLEIDEPSTEEVRQRYERDLDRYRGPERRHLFNIFRRKNSGADAGVIPKELERVRSQVLAGASFSSLATEISDSESRHRGGAVGWVEPGQLSEKLDQIVFDLAEGVPSEPLATAEGWHLFYVDSVIAAREFEFEEVRGLIAQELLAERREAEIDRRVSLEELPEGSFVPNAAELRALLSTGDSDVTVLRMGEYTVTADKLRALMAAEVRRVGPGKQDNLAWVMLERLRRQELIYRQRLEADRPLPAIMKQRLAVQADQLLSDRYRRQMMRRRLESGPASLRSFYEDNRTRFSSPLRLEIHRLLIPFSKQSADQMAALEGRRGDLDAGRTTLEAMAAEFGGSVEDLGWKTLGELGSIEPKMPAYVASIDSNAHSVPYRGANGLEMLGVVDREDPEPLPFEQARVQVESAFLERHAGDLYADLSRELLESVGFQLLLESLEDTRTSDQQAPE